MGGPGRQHHEVLLPGCKCKCEFNQYFTTWSISFPPFKTVVQLVIFVSKYDAIEDLLTVCSDGQLDFKQNVDSTEDTAPPNKVSER